jgi:hypothetical protein
MVKYTPSRFFFSFLITSPSTRLYTRPCHFCPAQNIFSIFVSCLSGFLCSNIIFFVLSSSAKLVKLSSSLQTATLAQPWQTLGSVYDILQLLSLLHSKLVLILAIQVHNLLTQPRLLHLLLKVIQRIQENIVITVFGYKLAISCVVLWTSSKKKLTHNG